MICWKRLPSAELSRSRLRSIFVEYICDLWDLWISTHNRLVVFFFVFIVNFHVVLYWLFRNQGNWFVFAFHRHFIRVFRERRERRRTASVRYKRKVWLVSRINNKNGGRCLMPMRLDLCYGKNIFPLLIKSPLMIHSRFRLVQERLSVMLSIYI